MASPFTIPHNLVDLEEEPEDDRLFVRNLIQTQNLTPSGLDELVKGVVFDLSDKDVFCIEEQEVFDQVYSLVKGFGHLEASARANLIESLRSNFSVLLPNIASLSRTPVSPHEAQAEAEPSPHERVASHRNALKIYTFFLQTILLSGDSGSGNAPKGTQSKSKKHSVQTWNWEVHRGRITHLLASALETDLKPLYGMSDPEENYISFVVKSAFSMFENNTLLKDPETKDALCRIIGACGTKYHYTMQTAASILHLIHKHDYLPQHMADLVAWAEKKYRDGSLALALITEIGRMNTKDFTRDTAGADNVGRFLVELSDRLPKLVSTNIGILVPHFGGESYKIRNALVGVFGKLIAKAFKDVEGDSAAKAHRLRGKQAMLEILLERCRDVSAYTRSRVLQVWAELCEERAVSIGLWNEVTEIAAGRLEDKSAFVRKSALNLLITMLQYNPFGPQLRTSSFEGTLEKYKQKLQEMAPAEHSEESGQGEVIDESTAHEDDGDVDSKLSNGGNGSINQIDSQSQDIGGESCSFSVHNGVSIEGPLGIANLEQTRALVASLEAGLRFAKCLSSTMPTLVQLLASSTATDVEHTILLLMRCRQFQIDGAEACLRKMLPLVFSQDKSIYDAVEGAFITIYVQKSATEAAANLLHLAIDSNIGDLAALEFIVSTLVAKGDISASVISALWDFFCFNVSGVTAEQSRGALSVLCMAAKTSTKILGSHLQDIIDIGFGRWAKVEPLLARTTCIALERLPDEDKQKLVSSCGNGSRVFSILQTLINGYWLPDHIWYSAVEKAISTIYIVHPTPEVLAAEVVRQVQNALFGCIAGEKESSDLDGDGANGGNFISAVQVSTLSRYFFVVGHVALNHLVYIETCVKKIQKQKTKKERSLPEDVQSGGMGAPLQVAAQDNNINAELGINASDDAKLDSLSEKAEKEIVSGNNAGKNLIGLCAPVLTKLCRNFSLVQKFPELHASGMLGLCKLMVIDANFCEANLQLLFTVAESAPTEAVRSNCTIALGDLAVRFPNLLEPWTEKMYGRLRDPIVSVRKNAVLVLSHLILNDMMKVKGYINEMALCLEDMDERIANLAKLFFNELSKKGSNPIYNLLPDILSRLSNDNLEEQTFCNIMQYLIGLIKKDKQMEGLVEKLCNRFCGVTDIKQWEGIAYCLSQLAFTEKGMKKLIESFKSYEHALSEDSVVEHFRNIISKAKKFSKPELRSCIEEFEEKLNMFHMEKKEQEMTTKNALFHQQKLEKFGNHTARSEGFQGEEEEENASRGTGEVIDPHEEMIPSIRKSEVGNKELEESSNISSEMECSETGNLEFQSPQVSQRRPSKTKRNVGMGMQEKEKARSSTIRRTKSTKGLVDFVFILLVYVPMRGVESFLGRDWRGEVLNNFLCLNILFKSISFSHIWPED
ncbi:hypothetical protein AMTRI_Chr01g129540 [Amborella trichopoda]|uniref:Condensin-1 complex subunit CAP-D2 n=2 Tax=Amborella trichopoda TaxID=13333 RepID=U5CSJ8_AMBTC|nr:condensin complex subunit 1 isoform X1 [Amborella trichopoda]ERN16221.1 hypothetical protein AMTR_s00063p00018970 [Amborella trichopoda]|eukprot:XP_020529472.1 condensin complex subunit 1 isoform X1 [Amborella trichopoda]